MNDIDTKRCHTPPTLAEYLGVAPEKIIRWIRKGELRASNVTANPSARPRYIITPEAVDEFLRARQPILPAPRAKRRRFELAKIDYFADLR